IDAVIFGLGNPGEEYTLTRHNIGFIVADKLAMLLSDVTTKRFGDAVTVTGVLGNKKVAVVKPLTFMNSSGNAVDSIMKATSLPLSSVLVLVDDFNIPLGTVRVRKSGSAGGHNGLKSIQSFVGLDYPRLRIGIGPLPEGISVIDFVLGKFASNELDALDNVMPSVIDACRMFLEHDLDAVMNKFNK
ncbi:MAG TPA: aminoacyl-tRNA hydrolase, partial [Chitinispirillaceae bacterium]|nr:aminoacyl-tRNA hydrolase [Chitinispirillaceae bacterium]